jgi:transposase
VQGFWSLLPFSLALYQPIMTLKSLICIAFAFFQQALLKCWNDGCRQGKVLLQELRERGFRSSYGSLARYLRCVKEAQESNPGTIQAQRFRLTACSSTWLVLRRPEKRIREEDEQLTWLRSQDPALEEAVSLAEDFARLMRGRHPEQLDDWLRRAVGSSLTAFVRFAGGLRED